MKKFIAIILSIVLIIGTAVPAFALRTVGVDEYRADTPVIYISGDSNELSYDNGTKTFAIEDAFAIYGNSEEGNISEATFNILYPFILKGIAFNDWDDYYEAVYKELSDVYAPIKLDENGDPNTDCDIPQSQKDKMADDMIYNRAENGKYWEKAYRFHYDWRLDPILLADRLHEYIEGVKKSSGHDKVSLSVKCLGSNVVLAYVDKYGTDSLKGVGIDVSTSMGADFLSGMVSGNFGLDGNAISRFAKYMSAKENFYTDIINFVASTLDLLELSGAVDTLTEVAREQLYDKIEYGIISALARSTFMTFPGYWAIVSVDDFDNAVRYVFGEEGDEKRETYKGLIEKITNYNETIKKNVYPIMQKLENGGVNLCIISKYGVPMLPTLKDGSILGDEYVSAYNSSFGATTATVYTTLSEDYIAQRVAEGNGRYISPDKQIDASTGLFPDYTWFFKGVPHGYYYPETDLIMQVIDADEQLTVDDFDLTQFIVYNYASKTSYPMTSENCDTEYWTADDTLEHPQTKFEKLRSFLTMLFRWLRNALKLFSTTLNNT